MRFYSVVRQSLWAVIAWRENSWGLTDWCFPCWRIERTEITFIKHKFLFCLIALISSTCPKDICLPSHANAIFVSVGELHQRIFNFEAFNRTVAKHCWRFVDPIYSVPVWIWSSSEYPFSFPFDWWIWRKLSWVSIEVGFLIVYKGLSCSLVLRLWISLLNLMVGCMAPKHPQQKQKSKSLLVLEAYPSGWP